MGTEGFIGAHRLMLYQTPRYRTSGECHVLVELGGTACLETNFRAIALSRALESSAHLGANGIQAILDTQPSFTTVLIEYAPELLTQTGVEQLCQHYLRQLAQAEQITLASRLIEIPVAYNDRWCRACFEDYCNTIKGIPDNKISQMGMIDAILILLWFTDVPGINGLS